jgi:DNA-binding NarL/FixJ family response regulator
MNTSNNINIKLAIADDHPMVVNGIKNMLYYYRHIEISDSWNSGKELLEGLAERQPDVLLLDLQLPDMTGNELARIIARSYPDVKILVITSMESTFHIKDMMKSGCKGYLLKTTSREILLEAIETIYQGGEYIDAQLKEQLLRDVLKKKGPATSLTRREKEILSLIAQELTSHEIAAQLNISQRTVENHRFSLMQKLNAKNTVSLIKISLEKGLI